MTDIFGHISFRAAATQSEENIFYSSLYIEKLFTWRLRYPISILLGISSQLPLAPMSLLFNFDKVMMEGQIMTNRVLRKTRELNGKKKFWLE